MAQIISYHSGLNQFTAFCSSDCYSSKGILANDSRVIYPADGNCGGLVSTQLGQAAEGEGGWKVIFNALDRPCCDGKGIGLATLDGSLNSSYTWLTNTSGAYERDPVLARLGTGGAVERYLVGWTTTNDGAFWLGVVNANGGYYVGPQDVTSVGVSWGDRDDSMRTRADGSVSWVYGAPNASTLTLYRFDSAPFLVVR
jgi:hypothetical protein